jgi:hypothetical protein
MTTRAKGISAGPLTVIVAASSRWPRTGGRRKRKGSVFTRSVSAVPHAVARGRLAVRQVERAAMLLGVVTAGLELLREIRFAGSNGTPSRHSPGRSAPSGYSQPQAGRPASRTSPTRTTSGGHRSASESLSRVGTKRPRSRAAAKKTRGARTTVRERSGSPATTKTGSVSTRAKRRTRSQASGKRTASSRR